MPEMSFFLHAAISLTSAQDAEKPPGRAGGRERGDSGHAKREAVCDAPDNHPKALHCDRDPLGARTKRAVIEGSGAPPIRRLL